MEKHEIEAAYKQDKELLELRFSEFYKLPEDEKWFEINKMNKLITKILGKYADESFVVYPIRPAQIENSYYSVGTCKHEGKFITIYTISFMMEPIIAIVAQDLSMFKKNEIC